MELNTLSLRQLENVAQREMSNVSEIVAKDAG